MNGWEIGNCIQNQLPPNFSYVKLPDCPLLWEPVLNILAIVYYRGMKGEQAVIIHIYLLK